MTRGAGIPRRKHAVRVGTVYIHELLGYHLASELYCSQGRLGNLHLLGDLIHLCCFIVGCISPSNILKQLGVT